jgi:hypothetical protein
MSKHEIYLTAVAGVLHPVKRRSWYSLTFSDEEEAFESKDNMPFSKDSDLAPAKASCEASLREADSRSDTSTDVGGDEVDSEDPAALVNDDDDLDREGKDVMDSLDDHTVPHSSSLDGDRKVFNRSIMRNPKLQLSVEEVEAMKLRRLEKRTRQREQRRIQRASMRAERSAVQHCRDYKAPCCHL